MNEVLDNPVYRALISGDQNLSLGTEKVKYFDKNVSPFAGFEDGYDNGFGNLHDLLPDGRNILYATLEHITEPKGWQLLQKIEGLQFIFDTSYNTIPLTFSPVRLEEQHIEQMMQLAKLTKPGPFGPRTIDFGHYFGIFDKEKLVAMTGQRLHVQQFTEVSAVCTHPSYLGKGYAAALIQHQLHLIRQKEQTPFLHVREDNLRAIELYKRIGFKIRGTMNFYFLKRETSH